MQRVFINYRRQDSEGYVGRLYDHLMNHFQPEDIFMDVSDIDPGQDFVKALEDAVADCDVLLAVIGPQWLNLADENGERRLNQWNDFVRIEISSALNQNKVVIPVLVGQSSMPSPNDLPEDLMTLARRNAIVLTHHRFKDDVGVLVKAIKTAIPANTSFKNTTNPAVLQKKTEAVKSIRRDLVGATESPLYHFRVENRYFPVIGEGHPDANIMFIGESPGQNEAETGVPFSGPSGDVLDEMLKSIELVREDVYITNVVLDRPPGNREPTKEELEFYTPFVDRLINVIQPAVLVTLGRFAMHYVLKKFDLPEKRDKISNLHGKLIKTELTYGEIHIVPLYHPAVVLYSGSMKNVLRQDFEKLKLFI